MCLPPPSSLLAPRLLVASLKLLNPRTLGYQPRLQVQKRRGGMGAATVCKAQCHCSFLALLMLCTGLLHPSQAFELHGGYGEEKVPLAVIVPDPSPELLSPLAAPPPLSGADDGERPRLPTERWRRGHRGEEKRGGAHAHAHSPAAAALAPSEAGPAPACAPGAAVDAQAPAPVPDSAGSGTTIIESSPAVPVPRGVTDTATILPMPVPGEKRQDVGAATLVRAGMVPLVVVFIMMASFGALCH